MTVGAGVLYESPEIVMDKSAEVAEEVQIPEGELWYVERAQYVITNVGGSVNKSNGDWDIEWVIGAEPEAEAPYSGSGIPYEGIASGSGDMTGPFDEGANPQVGQVESQSTVGAFVYGSTKVQITEKADPDFNEGNAVKFRVYGRRVL